MESVRQSPKNSLPAIAAGDFLSSPMEITISEQKSGKKPQPQNGTPLGFGNYFSDHMFCMHYDTARGWHDASITPYHNITLDPASLVLHYGQAIFEGMKAYYGKDDSIYLFRPRDYLRRMNRSAARLCMPDIDLEFILQALKKLIHIDREWIPRDGSSTLYIRPFMIASEAALGVKISGRYLFFIIVGPVGSYYSRGTETVKIYVSDKYVRSVRGGTGDVKTIGNYAASLYAAEEATGKGYDQVLWLDAIEYKYIEEVGTMNIFFYINDMLITPELSGSIIPGITRDSVIQIAEKLGIRVQERRISIDELIQCAEDGSLRESFGTGTAVVISPIAEFHYKGKSYQVGNGKAGSLAARLKEEILRIQYGEKEDPFGWLEKVNG